MLSLQSSEAGPVLDRGDIGKRLGRQILGLQASNFRNKIKKPFKDNTTTNSKIKLSWLS